MRDLAMNVSPHRIRRQRWKIRAGSASQALAIRGQLKQLWPEQLLPIFDFRFDELAGPQRVLRIPSLRLRLTVSSLDQLPEALSEALRQELPLQAQAAMADREIVEGCSSETADVSARDQFQVLLSYLRTGLIRWDAVRDSTVQSMQAVAEACRSQWALLLKHLLQEPEPAVFYFRLFKLVPAPQLGELLEAVFSKRTETWTEPLKQTFACLLLKPEAALPQTVRLTVAAHLLEETLSASRKGVPPDFASRAKQAFSTQVEARLPEFLASLPIPVRELFETGSTAKSPPPPLLDGNAPVTPLTKGDAEAAQPGKPAGTGRNLDPASQAPPSRLSSRRNEARPSEPADFPLLVQHAGLVLLHPFLDRFFVAVGCKEAGARELPNAALSRAACLLHYLATGDRKSVV